ncbi:MAG: glycosyltransferase [Flavobacterium sp.]|uniref:glycosyltransferase n=1 Tax=Flavobacterium sp. TaxID=239 RepID=UPI0022C11832|nr:glycosyltransferase [Flavobacterium sp.]MCZ8197318.1 glycosyltransferase [Flavobacterium sp.]
MRILFTTDQIYLHGGIEKVMAEKANYFADVLNYEVYILTTEQKGYEPCYFLSNKIKRVDIGVNYIRFISYFHPKNISKIPFHFKQWKKTISAIKPDVIISCNYAFDFYWTPFFLRQIPKLKEFHSSRYFEEIDRKNASFLKKMIFLINDFIESKYTKLILLNDDEAQYYRSNNLEIIPNPITINDDSVAILNNHKAIAAGRIAPVKGFEKAILAWKIVVEQNSDWELHIYGQGEKKYIESLQNLINENNLQKNVIIKNAVSNLDLILLDYSIYVMTSLTECFPMILLESLASGLPIVSFDCPHGPKNIITNNEDGFIVKNQDIIALSEKINLLINDHELRIAIGKKGKQNSYRFSKENVILKWQNLFNSLILKN